MVDNAEPTADEMQGIAQLLGHIVAAQEAEEAERMTAQPLSDAERVYLAGPLGGAVGPQDDETDDNGILYRSDVSWPAGAPAATWRVQMWDDPWHIVGELDDWGCPWELYADTDGGHTISVVEGDQLAEYVVGPHCIAADSIWSVMDGGLAGVELGTAQRLRAGRWAAIRRVAPRLALWLTLLSAALATMAYVWMHGA